MTRLSRGPQEKLGKNTFYNPNKIRYKTRHKLNNKLACKLLRGLFRFDYYVISEDALVLGI